MKWKKARGRDEYTCAEGYKIEGGRMPLTGGRGWHISCRAPKGRSYTRQTVGSTTGNVSRAKKMAEEHFRSLHGSTDA